jgi:hypothetical protein
MQALVSEIQEKLKQLKVSGPNDSSLHSNPIEMALLHCPLPSLAGPHHVHRRPGPSLCCGHNSNTQVSEQ